MRKPLMGIFLVRNFIHTLHEFTQTRKTRIKSSEKNSILSIGFIVGSFAVLVASVISYYSGTEKAVFFILLSCFAFTVSIGTPVAFSLGMSRSPPAAIPGGARAFTAARNWPVRPVMPSARPEAGWGRTC